VASANRSPLDRLGTAIAACAWVVLCGYLYAWWPSLSAYLEMRDAVPPWAHCLARLPRLAFAALALCALLALRAKERRRLSPRAAVLAAALIGSPAFVGIGFLLYPVLVRSP
jgi:cytochrome bd-type quinol oxidase subunit 2